MHALWRGLLTALLTSCRPPLVCACQAALKSLHVDVKQLVSQGTAVGACYHLVATKQDGEVAELRIIAVFGIDKAGKIASCDAVSRLVSGSIGDERLATLMPSQ